MSAMSEAIRKELIAQGLTPGSKEYESARGRLRYQFNRERERVRSARRYRRNWFGIKRRRREIYNSSPEQRQRNIEKHKKYWLDPGYREKRIEQRKAWAETNRLKQRAYANEWYSRVRHTIGNRKIYNRIKNSPLYGLKGALRDFERGAIGIDELNRLYDRALTRLNDVSGRRSKGT